MGLVGAILCGSGDHFAFSPLCAVGLPCSENWVIIPGCQPGWVRARPSLSDKDRVEGCRPLAEQPQPHQKSIIREFIETLLLTLLLYAVIRGFLFENYRVVGRSMMPTLHDNQYLAVNKLSYRLHPPERGDIIVFRDPNGDGRKLIKRVIGLEGEAVEILNGQVYVNQQPLPEPYLQEPGNYSYRAITVPPGQVFVLGDNRNNSSDSHDWGTLSEEMIVGKAWISYWPPELWTIIRHETYDGQS